MLCYERELAAIKERLETHKAERKRLLAAIEWRDEDRGRLEELLGLWRKAIKEYIPAKESKLGLFSMNIDFETLDKIKEMGLI
jgi:hypothetical protein